MPTTLRSPSAAVLLVLGPALILLGLITGIAAVVLCLVLGSAWFLALLLPGLLAGGCGIALLVMRRRARLEIGTEGILWCGYLGSPRGLRWDEILRIQEPADGRTRLAALAALHDGRVVEIRALWLSPTSPVRLLDGQDLRHARALLIAAHRDWLARQAGRSA